MNKHSISHEAERSKKLNGLLQGLHNLYKDDLERVIYLCYDLGGTQEEIAEALGLSRGAVAMKYPKKKEKNHGEE